MAYVAWAVLLGRGMMSDADHFEIHFPLDLDTMMKAMVFGACFLIVSLSLLSS